MRYITLLIICSLTACVTMVDPQVAQEQFKTETGFKEITVSSGAASFYGKNYRGYDFIYATEAGDVWGRWATRVALGEALNNVSGGHYRSDIVGTQLDRLLSRLIGQPITIVVVAKHHQKNASRLDIITPFSTVKSPDPQPKYAYIGLNTGSIYSADSALAEKIKNNQSIMERISDLYSPYISIDQDTVTYIYSGPETDLSSMIRSHGSYANLVNNITDLLADIADQL